MPLPALTYAKDPDVFYLSLIHICDVVAAGEPEANNPDYVQGAKGVDGGAVRLLGSYAS